MFSLIVLIATAVGFGFFATQNTTLISIHFAGPYSFDNVPLYLIIGATLLLGFFLSWLIHLVNTLSSSLRLRHKDQNLSEANKTITDLTKRTHQLELENARLAAGSKTQLDDSM